MSDLQTGTDHLLGRVEDGVAVLEMNNPERRNALSDDMTTALIRVLAELEVDDDVGCVVLTGTGGTFCAGGDVKRMRVRNEGPPQSLERMIDLQLRRMRGTVGQLWAMGKPTIAKVRGAAVGAGLALALACDLRYVAPEARLSTAFARVGLAGDYGTIWFLSRLVGGGRARELMYFSDQLPVEEAKALGIVNDVIADEDLDAEVMARAKRLAQGPSLAFRYMKANLDSAITMALPQYLEVEVARHRRSATTEDHQEAVRAFTEKRPPVFRGK